MPSRTAALLDLDTRVLAAPHLASSPEFLCPVVVEVHIAAIVCQKQIAYTDFGIGRIQNVGKVTWAIHPALHNFFRSLLTSGNVLTIESIVIVGS